jgi:hypothetical protein
VEGSRLKALIFFLFGLKLEGRGKVSPFFALVMALPFSCGVAEIIDFPMVLQGLWSARG